MAEIEKVANKTARIHFIVIPLTAYTLPYCVGAGAPPYHSMLLRLLKCQCNLVS
jgi:hypothetical protein